AEPFRQRLLDLLNRWPAEAELPKKKSKPSGGVRALAGTNLDLAVARGAAYYGLVRRGKGVRIRGGTARAYYFGVETSLPAGPRRSRPCAWPRSAWKKAPRLTCPSRNSV